MSLISGRLILMPRLSEKLLKRPDFIFKWQYMYLNALNKVKNSSWQSAIKRKLDECGLNNLWKKIVGTV